MKPEIKDYILNAVRQRTGDDLERANRAFGRMTDAQLDQQYGESGKTCREIWQTYKDERAINLLAIAAVERMP